MGRLGHPEHKNPMHCAQSATKVWVPGGLSPGPSPAALAREAPPAAVAAAKAREAKAPRGDGHSLRAEDAANSSRSGGSHGGVLREGAEDGAGQGHHHRRGLDEDVGVLALLDTGLIAAVGQRGRATGSTWQAWQALVVAGHVSRQDLHLVGERDRRNMAVIAEQCPTHHWIATAHAVWGAGRCLRRPTAVSFSLSPTALARTFRPKELPTKPISQDICQPSHSFTS